jgi:hypothetical protein
VDIRDCSVTVDLPDGHFTAQPLAFRRHHFAREIKLNLSIQPSGYDSVANAIAGGLAVAPHQELDALVLVKFVKALARRQARLDAGIALQANDANKSRTLH